MLALSVGARGFSIRVSFSFSCNLVSCSTRAQGIPQYKKVWEGKGWKGWGTYMGACHCLVGAELGLSRTALPSPRLSAYSRIGACPALSPPPTHSDRLRAAVDHVVKYLDMDALVASAGPWVGSRTLAAPTGTRATTPPATALESTPAAAGTSASPSTQVAGAPVAPSLSASGVGGGAGASQQSTGHVPAAGATGALFM